MARLVSAIDLHVRGIVAGAVCAAAGLISMVTVATAMMFVPDSSAYWPTWVVAAPLGALLMAGFLVTMTLAAR